jgi:hypothetical protein
VGEVVPDEEQRLVHVPGERAGEAVAVVQPRRMSTRLAVPAKRLARDTDLDLSYRFYNQSDLLQKLIKERRNTSVLSPVNHHIGFQQIPG